MAKFRIIISSRTGVQILYICVHVTEPCTLIMTISRRDHNHTLAGIPGSPSPLSLHFPHGVSLGQELPHLGALVVLLQGDRARQMEVAGHREGHHRRTRLSPAGRR